MPQMQDKYSVQSAQLPVKSKEQFQPPQRDAQ